MSADTRRREAGRKIPGRSGERRRPPTPPPGPRRRAGGRPVFLPFMHVHFHPAPLSLAAWGQSLLVGALVLPMVGLEKAVRRKPKGTPMIPLALLPEILGRSSPGVEEQELAGPAGRVT